MSFHLSVALPVACSSLPQGREGGQEETSLQELRSTWLISVLIGGVPDFCPPPLISWLSTEKRDNIEMEIKEIYMVMDGLIHRLSRPLAHGTGSAMLDTVHFPI